MQQEERELRLNQLRLIVMVMTLIFAFMLVYTIYFLVDYKDKYGFFNKTTAEVIEHQVINNKEYDLISYKVDGNEFRITTEYESKNDIGDTITIYYDTNNPLGVVYSLDSRRVWLPVLLTIFGCVNVGLIVVYFLLKRSILKGNKIVAGTDVLDFSNAVEMEEVIRESNNKEVVEKTKKSTKNSVNAKPQTVENKPNKNASSKSKNNINSNSSKTRKKN